MTRGLALKMFTFFRGLFWYSQESDIWSQLFAVIASEASVRVLFLSFQSETLLSETLPLRKKIESIHQLGIDAFAPGSLLWLMKMIFDDNNIVKYNAAHQRGEASRPLFCLLPQVEQMIFSIVWHIKTGTKARDASFVSRFISEPFGLGDGRLIEG